MEVFLDLCNGHVALGPGRCGQNVASGQQQVRVRLVPFIY